ncbi:ABC transporter substrate-binding protein [Sinomonas terrae]|uniref:ABC transporter substrate-binding protein n=1 Tax=Sinomonas terrae TaxID=2908838 RepID=A0ABS9TXN4_9MICC|nr:ABC transporter substrate-binding protein [Sinomonas terrae]MCH6469189.1 ABC transporter substrate-binding protein [Sinomonas terrae]
MSKSPAPDTGTPQRVRITAETDTTRARRGRGLTIGIGAALVLLLGVGAAIATANANQTASQPNQAAIAQTGTPAAQLRLGYFANVTHAPAVIGVRQGLISEALKAAGTNSLTTQVFNAGPAEIEALNAGAIDAAYVGPNPAINSFAQSKGQSLVVVAGVAAGGAQLVVRPGINSAADLKGKTLATPQLGNTQDVALRAWLAKQGYKTNPNGSGDVTIDPTDNAQTLKLFQAGKLDGAWLPEPWASRLVLQAGAHVLVDEKTLWDGSQTGKPGLFPTTVLVVNKKFAADHPQTVEALVKGDASAIDWLNKASDTQKVQAVNDGLKAAAGQALPANVVQRALGNITFTTDPLAGAYPKLLQDGVDAGVSKTADLHGLFDLSILNRVSGEAKVSAAGLGQE